MTSKKIIYVDHAATTAMSPRVLEAMLPYLREIYANPSSLHQAGQKAAEALSAARQSIADRIGAAYSREIYFTSGGSEADQQAIQTAAELGRKQGKRHILTTAFEHHAVLRPLQRLQQEGFTVTRLDVHESGRVTAEEVEQSIRPDTCLVSVMYANNEIGTIQPIAEIGAVCRQKGVLFHTDAVQAVGHLPIDVQRQNIDLLSASAHKFHGAKGAGFLYCRSGVPLLSLLEGGAQERGKRAGTENVPAIVAMEVALRETLANLPVATERIRAMRDRLWDGLAKIPHAACNGDRNNRLPGNVSICFEGIEGEALLLLLDQAGICASSGSACTSGSLEPSHVLLAIGRPHEIAHGSLRLTLDDENTQEDVSYMLKVIPDVVNLLREMSPIWQDKMAGKLPFLLPE